MSNQMSATATYESTSQAGMIIQGAFTREGSQPQRPFIDNLDHLQALELEAKLMLAVAVMRNSQNEAAGKDNPWEETKQYFPFIPAGANLGNVKELLAEAVAENRQREQVSLQSGIDLKFCTLVDNWTLDRFERAILLILLMSFSSTTFSMLIDNCDLGGNRWNAGLEIGTLLDMISDNYREQLECRRYFSVNGTLMKSELLVIKGCVDDTDNILDEKVYLYERIARYIVGDDNQYNSAFQFIKKEKCKVSMEQVILPDHLKEEVAESVVQYLQNREDGIQGELDDFFGYGTSLVFLFHGPSGTGKTMFARALASHCHRDLISFCATDMQDIHMGDEEIMAALFREANLQNGIVFLDECDDIFTDNSRASRALLLEIEKARCIVIMATNKPVDLDPAMERRISRKIAFRIPPPDLRRQMWRSLMPPTVKLAPDVDLDELGDRYQFTGGLIKNAILMAITASTAERGRKELFLDRQALEQAAALQNPSITDQGGLCAFYHPQQGIAALPVSRRQREELTGVAQAWRQLKTNGLGLNCLLSTSDLPSGIAVVEALARDCGLAVRRFDFSRMLTLSEGERVVDPITQRKVLPMDYAFSSAIGDASVTLFVDYEGMMATMFEAGKESTKSYIAPALLSKLRENKGLFFVVTKESNTL